jgi:hypothetical protein
VSPILAINNPINHEADDVYSLEINRFFRKRKPYIIATLNLKCQFNEINRRWWWCMKF